MRIDWPTMFAIFFALVLFEFVNQTIIMPRHSRQLPSKPNLDSTVEEESLSVDAYVHRHYAGARTIGG